MTKEKKQSSRIEKLIDLLKSFASDKPVSNDPDYSSWRQTEAEYQEQQAEWMASVKKRKQKRRKMTKSPLHKSQK